MNSTCRPASILLEAKAANRMADHAVLSERRTHRKPLVGTEAAANLRLRLQAKLALVVGLMMLPALTPAAGESARIHGQLIWKTIPAAEGEPSWHACRRVFGLDVIRSRPGPYGTASCFVPYHYLNEQGQRHQNFGHH